MKCIVCNNDNAVKMTIMDGYMDSGEFNVCGDRNCYRQIVSDGVHVWLDKKKDIAYHEYMVSDLDPRD